MINRQPHASAQSIHATAIKLVLVVASLIGLSEEAAASHDSSYRATYVHGKVEPTMYTIALEVDADSRILWNGNRIDHDTMIRNLHAAIKSDYSTIGVTVFLHKKAEQKIFTKILNEIQNVGFTQVTMTCKRIAF